MPRTKRVASKKRSQSIENIKPNKVDLDRNTIQAYLKNLDNEIERSTVQLDNGFHRIRLALTNKITELCLSIQKDNDKSISELRITKFVSNETTRNNTTVNSTRTLNRTRLPRSSSADRLAGNTVTKKPRASRSLSRQTKNNFITPAHKQPPQIFGTVTPKVKPNAPQVVLRRPMQGEIAISMQGSPLMVSGVTSDSIPNINIPLHDGRMIAIQPERGLRFSDLPEFDAATKRNLELLRDNLNKVCGDRTDKI